MIAPTTRKVETVEKTTTGIDTVHALPVSAALNTHQTGRADAPLLGTVNTAAAPEGRTAARALASERAERLIGLLSGLLSEIGKDEILDSDTMEYLLDRTEDSLPTLPALDTRPAAHGTAVLLFGEGIDRLTPGEDRQPFFRYGFTALRAILDTPTEQQALTLLTALGIASHRMYGAGKEADTNTPAADRSEQVIRQMQGFISGIEREVSRPDFSGMMPDELINTVHDELPMPGNAAQSAQGAALFSHVLFGADAVPVTYSDQHKQDLSEETSDFGNVCLDILRSVRPFFFAPYDARLALYAFGIAAHRLYGKEQAQ